jgi:hypothetical protein
MASACCDATLAGILRTGTSATRVLSPSMIFAAVLFYDNTVFVINKTAGERIFLITIHFTGCVVMMQRNRSFHKTAGLV